jgi:hypothetical protein
MGQAAGTRDRLGVFLEGPGRNQNPILGQLIREDRSGRACADVAETQLPGVSLRTAGNPPAEPALAGRDTQLRCGISTQRDEKGTAAYSGSWGSTPTRHDRGEPFDVVA